MTALSEAGIDVFVEECGGVKLNPQQNLALLHRMLWREGYDDRIAGHITARLPDDTIICTPYGLAWNEIRASDILTIDRDGNLLEGTGEVPLPITLHLVAHEMRRDIHVAVHQHPRWATAWAAARRVPAIFDQLGAFGGAGLVCYEEYLGAVDDREIAKKNVAGMGDASVALLANHGVFVLGNDIVQTHTRAVVLEHRCALAARVEQIGGGQVLDDDVAAALGERLAGGWPQFFEAMVRSELRLDPAVLD